MTRAEYALLDEAYRKLVCDDPGWEAGMRILQGLLRRAQERATRKASALRAAIAKATEEVQK